MAQAYMNGARLAYVVVPLEGEVTRKINTWTKKAGLGSKYVDQPAGFMVYFPRGHVLRIRDRQMLRQYRLDKPAKIINLEGLADPNSPLGKMMMSQDDNARRGAFEDMEKQVIKLAQATSGRIELTKDERELPKHPDERDE
jgi:hypothetical protein